MSRVGIHQAIPQDLKAAVEFSLPRLKAVTYPSFLDELNLQEALQNDLRRRGLSRSSQF